jgi:hypothetical protein
VKDQLTLLRRVHWDVLIVLDACRADYFDRVAPNAGAEAVRAAASCTAGWVRRARPVLSGCLYLTANPVVSRELEREPGSVEIVSLWRNLWARLTDRRIPAVHPWAVNGAVLGWHEQGRLNGRRIVVHYLQPHSPYVGRTPLPMARWGPSGNALAAECSRLRRPDAAVREGDLSWRLVRRAYRENLRLAWRAARHLAHRLEGQVVVTADHGEVLGEHGGRFGHECHWEFEELFRVPWLPLSGVGADPSAVQEKLEALGYA